MGKDVRDFPDGTDAQSGDWRVVRHPDSNRNLHFFAHRHRFGRQRGSADLLLDHHHCEIHGELREFERVYGWIGLHADDDRDGWGQSVHVVNPERRDPSRHNAHAVDRRHCRDLDHTWPVLLDGEGDGFERIVRNCFVLRPGMPCWRIT